MSHDEGEQDEKTDYDGGGDNLGIVGDFERSATWADDVASLERLLDIAVRALGFTYYALVEHRELDAPRALVLSNYPVSWRAFFAANDYHRIDPVQQACRNRVAGFRWTQLEQIIALSPAQRSLLAASRMHGLGDGYTVPLHLPGAHAASCSFAVEPADRLPDVQTDAHHLAVAAYERIRALGGLPQALATRLSPRERDCVALVAAGLTDGEVARKLGLSEETVTKYLNEARRRNGLARRAQLVAAALRDGLIGFDALDS